ncbi:MAG: exopolysaccharide biosynthesis polyprenyl glycosylphosphotransferase [Hyphomicrobium sp.]
MNDWAPVSKRLEDLVLASLMLVASLPLWPLIAVAIKLDSPGPILFRQRRRGRHQTVVHILKFRTMSVVENDGAIRQAVPGDSRITRVGRFLRRTSLDELPQLLNVLSGEMSIVGPRPHALAHDEEFARMLDLYPNRHQMKPGMTGLAQVSGLRGPTTRPGAIEARVEADLDYVLSWSLWLDLKILGRTIAAVIRGENAD